MSSSIAIPKRAQNRGKHQEIASLTPSSLSSSSPISSSSYNSADSPKMYKGHDSASSSPNVSTSPYLGPISARRPSLLGSTLAHSEYTVIDVGGPGRPLRLVGCVKSSQGFDWNQELFLSHHIDYDSSDLEVRPDPVDEIILTDEEAAAMLPQ